MRNVFIYLLPVAICWSCGNNKKSGGFELTGQLTNTNNEKLYLEKLASPQPEIVDSVEVDDEGKFSFENYTPNIGFYRIRQNQQNFAMLVLDSNDRVKVTGNLADLGNSYKVEGSAETSLFLEYNNIARKRDQQLDSMNNIVQSMMEPNKHDTKRVDSITAAMEVPYNRIIEASNQALVSKIMANTDKYSSIMAIQALEPDKHAEAYKALSEGLGKKFPLDQNVKMFQDVVKRVLALAVGQTAPEIGLPSPEGPVVYLSSFRGKVVLIDFWASWCGPCRREMPAVVKAYEKYRNKGFEIFGVSLDQDKSRWVEAIQTDKITWPQVSDLKNWQSEAARAYNVQSIPYTVLLDAEGRIIAKNLRGEELDKKLAEVLGKPSGTARTVIN